MTENRNHTLRDDTERVFIRDLELSCSIGIHDHEKQTPQRVLINIDMALKPLGIDLDDDYVNVVCYETVANQVRALVTGGHVNLVETLAENIASICLENIRVSNVRVRVEKPDIIADAVSVGIEIVRYGRKD